MTGFEVAAIAGVIISAAGAITTGIQASKVQKFNAALAAREGEISGQIAAVAAEDVRRRGRRRQGAIVAAGGEQGFETGTGSVADILADDARETEFAARIALFGGELAGFRGEAEARVRRFQASAALQQGFIKAGGTLLGGAFSASNAGFFGGSGATGFSSGPNIPSTGVFVRSQLT